MNEHPINFTDPEDLQAIQDGAKVEDRRPVNMKYIEFIGGRDDDRNNPSNWGYEDPDGDWLVLDQKCPNEGYEHRLPCPWGNPGDLLWVREPWYITPSGDCAGYAATGRPKGILFTKRSAMHLQRKNSRITLELIDQQIKRLWMLDEFDCINEGWQPAPALVTLDGSPLTENPLDWFRRKWDKRSTNKNHQWEKNDFVWVLKFKLVNK